jgi:hypothetical protein
VFETGFWNPEIHMVLWVWHVTLVCVFALSLPKMQRMSEGSLEDTTMYPCELFDQGLISCTFVCVDENFSCYCHNSHSLYMALLSDIQIFLT